MFFFCGNGSLEKLLFLGTGHKMQIFRYLLTTTNRRAVSDLMPMIGARFYIQLDALQTQCDMQDDELAKEMENGRLYRLLVKLGCINERPE